MDRLKLTHLPLLWDDFKGLSKAYSFGINKVNEVFPKRNFKLYHYTDYSGLSGIIKGECLWLSKLNFLNDYTELTYGLSIFNECLNQLEQTIKKNGLFPTRDIAYRFLQLRMLFVDMNDGKDSPLLFSISFCKKNNLLSQWRAYTKKDDSYCIEFDANTLFSDKHLFPHNEPYVLRKILYSPKKQLNIAMNLLTIIWDEFKLLNFKSLEAIKYDQSEMAYRMSLNEVVYHIASCFKHPDFREEEEYRMIRSIPVYENANMVEVRPGINFPVPYVVKKLKLQFLRNVANPILSVLCGPSKFPEQKKEAIKILLLSKKIRIAVKNSDTPLR